MKILILTSNDKRHHYFVGKLIGYGLEVQAWAEAKGKSLNEDYFSEPMGKKLLQMHKNLLSSATEQAIGDQIDDPAIEVFSRGSFKGDTLVPRIKKYDPNFV